MEPADDAPKKRKRPFKRVRKKPRSTRPGEHRPVMPAECLAALALKPGETAVDCTLGFAGHSRLILEAVGPAGKLIALDLDGANLDPARQLLSPLGGNFALHHANFAGLASVIAAEGLAGVDAIFADLGVSSMQLDDRERGFSFLRDGPLDMRMDPTRGKTAATLLATLSEDELAALFRDYGDEPSAEIIAAVIAHERQSSPLERTLQLTELVERAAPVDVLRGPGRPPARKQRLLPATRVFQALRIAVNRELANLTQLLRVAPHLLNPGGRLVILSFHSGEDRLVKAAFRDGVRAGVYAEVSGNAGRPTEAEKLDNPRARSGKLRFARVPG